MAPLMQSHVPPCIPSNPREGSLSTISRTLSGSASLLSRPEFTLMRRVRDSIMFVTVNSVTILALTVAGVLFSFISSDPVQTLLRQTVYPVVWGVLVDTQQVLVSAVHGGA